MKAGDDSHVVCGLFEFNDISKLSKQLNESKRGFLHVLVVLRKGFIVWMIFLANPNHWISRAECTAISLSLAI